MPEKQIHTIHLTSKFKKNFKKLPQHIQKKAVQKDNLFRTNAFDKRLSTHTLSGKLNDYYSYSVDDNYRVLFGFINNHQ